MKLNVLVARSEWERAGPGIVKQTLHGDNMTYIRYRFDPHAVFPLHQHDQEQLVVLNSGSATCEVGMDVTHLLSGDSVFIPLNMPHRITAGDRGVEISCVLSPPRTPQTGYKILDEPW